MALAKSFPHFVPVFQSSRLGVSFLPVGGTEHSETILCRENCFCLVMAQAWNDSGLEGGWRLGMSIIWPWRKTYEHSCLVTLACVCVWCMYTCICRCVCPCAHMWMTEEDIRHLPSLYTLVFPHLLEYVYICLCVCLYI